LAYISHLDKIQLAGDIPLGKTLLSLLVPGYSFRLSGRKKLAGQILLGCGVAAILYIALLGYFIGNLFFGLLVGLHATGLIHLNNMLSADSPLQRRVVFGICGVLALFIGYRLILSVVENNWLVPLRFNGHVVVINRLASLKAVQRGGVIAYSLQPFRTDGFFFAGGFGLDRVLGVAGDKIAFKSDCVEVNGQSYPRHKLMPYNGVMTVPENSWFIWPAYNITVEGHAPPENMRTGLVAAAMVQQKYFVGRPFKSWFGRRQKLP
jgi:hypothetical protein